MMTMKKAKKPVATKKPVKKPAKVAIPKKKGGVPVKPGKRPFTEILAKRKKTEPEEIRVPIPRSMSFKRRVTELFMLHPNDAFISDNTAFGLKNRYGRVIYQNSGLVKVELWTPGDRSTHTDFIAPRAEVYYDNPRGPMVMPKGDLRSPRYLEEVVTNMWWTHGPNFHHRLDAAKLFADANLRPEELTPELLEIVRMRCFLRTPIRQTPLDKSDPSWHKDEDSGPIVIPLKSDKKPKPVAALPKVKGVTPKKPGVITKIIEVLRSATKKKPVTKEQVLKVLSAEFPDRAPSAMKNTIGSQIPSGLKTEKGIIVSTDGKGGWWINAK